MEKNIEDILKSISSDILTEDVKKSIATMFTESVEAEVKSKLDLVVENELAKMDDEHSEKLDKLIESIDEDHTQKMKAIVEKLDQDYGEKLQKVVEKYENELKEGAETLRNELTTKMSNYLDIYLAESIPADQLKEAVQNIHARKLIDQIKQIVSVDEEFISENFKEALKDGHKQIEDLKAELNKTIKESTDVKQQLNNTKATLVLEQKTRDLPEAKKKYVSKLLEGKKPEEIEANFKFVVEMYEKDEADKTETILESEKQKTKTSTSNVDAPKTMTESVKADVEPGSEDTSRYLAGFEENKIK